MKITKRPAGDIELEAAHGGSGSRKMLLDNVSTNKIEAMTDGFLPGGVCLTGIITKELLK